MFLSSNFGDRLLGKWFHVAAIRRVPRISSWPFGVASMLRFALAFWDALEAKELGKCWDSCLDVVSRVVQTVINHSLGNGL